MMGRLPSCTAHDVDRVLTRQGFVVTHQRGSHRYYRSPITGKIVTSVPMHPGDLNHRQCLTPEQSHHLRLRRIDELVHRHDALDIVAAVGEDARVAREGRGIAGDRRD